MKISQFNKFLKGWWCTWMFIFLFLSIIILSLQVIHILNTKTSFFIKDRVVEVPVFHEKPQPLCGLDEALNEWGVGKYRGVYLVFTDDFDTIPRYQLEYTTNVMVDGTEIEAEIERRFPTLNDLTIYIQSKVEANKLNH